jgi:mono/diheme cytochrome c family protein
MKTRIQAVAIAVLAGIGAWHPALRAQEATRTVWDGVYTEAQAKRGAALYRKHCASCHGEALEGDGEAPPLAGGEPFWNWNGKPLTGLFDKIQKDSPPKEPGTLSREVSADLLAYILSFNKFPAGQTELPHAAEALNKIRYQSKK